MRVEQIPACLATPQGQHLLVGGVARLPAAVSLCGCSAATPMQSLPSSTGASIQHKRYAMHRSLGFRQGEIETFVVPATDLQAVPADRLGSPSSNKATLIRNAVLFWAPPVHRTRYPSLIRVLCQTVLCHFQTPHGTACRVGFQHRTDRDCFLAAQTES